MKKTLLLCLLLIGVFETTYAADKRGKIYALIVGDTDAPHRIGESVEVDVECMERSLATIASGINFRLHTVILTEEECAYDDVASELRDLHTSSKDIIIFYYSGHGFNNPAFHTCWPVLQTRGRCVLGKRVIEYLQSQPKRFALILLDCCNTVREIPKFMLDTKSFVKPFVLRKSHNLKGLFKLLLSSKGTVIAAGSRVGRVSCCDPNFGGCFTREFLTSMYDLGTDETLSWSKVLNLVRKKTNHRAFSSHNTEQHPIYSIEPR
jgi:hypothetical protein